MQRIVVLGAGSVARAHVQYLLERGLAVTVASRTVAKARDIVAEHPNGTPLAFDLARESHRLGELLAGHDLAVSLLPWQFHPQVAEACIAHRTHLVTTSYVQPAMRSLDDRAREAGVTLLNEIGVDPGIDHMTAMQIIHRVEGQGGRIEGFTSWCGGLPAPEADDNPLGYKFSWSPRGVLLAGTNPGRFRRDGVEVEVPGGDLFDFVWPVEIEVGGAPKRFEGYPNRDSLPYQDAYGIHPPETMFRGTLRNPGWCPALRALSRLGWLAEAMPRGFAGTGFGELTAHLAGASGDLEPRRAAAAYLGLEPDAPELDSLDWLGLFSRDALPADAAGPVDALTARMLERMSYRPGERDMVVLEHRFDVSYDDRRERITSTMVDFGIPGGDTSMARTVGLPAAVAARCILEQVFTRHGVVVPVYPDVYEPVLEELGRLGVHFAERVVPA